MKLIAELSTEVKILQAARKVFVQKGFAATRIRHIAQEAGINMAMLNYYFRSKEKLFSLIMQETLTTFLCTLEPVINDQLMSLPDKLDMLTTHFTDMLVDQPDLPLFMFNELKNNPELILDNVNYTQLLLTSHLTSQFQAERPDLDPLQFIMNTFGLIVFPFIGKSMIQEEGTLDLNDFTRLVQQRRALIPIWIKAMLKTT